MSVTKEELEKYNAAYMQGHPLISDEEYDALQEAYVKEHGDEVTDKEKYAIDRVLGYDTLASRYKSGIADPVKNGYNKYTTSEDLKEYFKVWFKELIKHPKTYIEATISNTYGYFYPSKTNWYIYYKYNNTITYDGFDYHYNSLKIPRYILASYGIAFPYIPVLNILVNIVLEKKIVVLFVYKNLKGLIL